MKVESTWLNIKDGGSGKKLVVNLKWLLAWRSITGLNISDKYVDREIELSNGNLKWVDKDFECIGIHVRIAFKFNSIYYIVYNDKFHIKVELSLLEADVIYKNYHVIEIETDFDEKVQKLNKRLSLLGSDNAYKVTNGTNIININQHSRIHNYDDLVDNTIFTYEDGVNIQKDLYLDVSDCDFVDFCGVQYEDIELCSNKEKYLQYINGYSTMFGNGGMLIEKTIHAEEASQVCLCRNGMGIFDAKRVRKCYIDLAAYGNYIDLSGIDFIDTLEISDENCDYDAYSEKQIDFGDKFILFSGPNPLEFNLYNEANIKITSSNKETYDTIKKIVDRIEKSRKRYLALEFTEEQ